MTALHWLIMLLLGALLLGALELFVPSGGVLGVAALLLFMGAILAIGFQFGAAVGVAFLIGSMILLPAIIVWVLRWWPKTPMGRRFLPPIPTESETRPDNEQLRFLRSLVGKFGRAKTMMLPSGAAVIDGHNINAISEGLPIEAGQLVRVVEVRGNRVVVRCADDLPEPQRDSGDLSRPIDALGLEPLDDRS